MGEFQRTFRDLSNMHEILVYGKFRSMVFIRKKYIFLKKLLSEKKFICKRKDELPRSHTRKAKDVKLNVHSLSQDPGPGRFSL